MKGRVIVLVVIAVLVTQKPRTDERQKKKKIEVKSESEKSIEFSLKGLQSWSSLRREFTVENEDVPPLLLIVGGRRRLLFSPLHEDTPHHIFGPQIDGLVNMAVLVLVRIPGKKKESSSIDQIKFLNFAIVPAINDGEVFDMVTEFATD